VRLAGIAALSLGCLGFVLSYALLAGEPESPVPEDYTNPTWFKVLGSACFGLLFVGITLVLLPVVHKALRHK